MKADWEINPFKPGDAIEFAGDRYTIVKNYGDRGAVTDGSGLTISPFYWTFQGEDCIRVKEEIMLTWMTNAYLDKIDDMVEYLETLNPDSTIKVGGPKGTSKYSSSELHAMGCRGIYKETKNK